MGWFGCILAIFYTSISRAKARVQHALSYIILSILRGICPQIHGFTLAIMETILAILDALSQDLARENVGIKKIDSDMVNMHERLDRMESRRNSRTFTPETLLPMTNPPRQPHNTTSQAPNSPQNREQDRPLPPQVDQVQLGGLGGKFSPIQAPQPKLHVTKSSLSIKTSLSKNRTSKKRKMVEVDMKDMESTMILIW